ncbi:MAG: hypothetical protein Q9201_007260 [Fulgogasparrea decipioides]
MASSVENGQTVTQAATGPVTHRPLRQTLPLTPAIPRKLEKKLRDHSSSAAASRTIISTPLEPPCSRPIGLNVGSSQDGIESHVPQEQDTHEIKQLKRPGYKEADVQVAGADTIGRDPGDDRTTAEESYAAPEPPPTFLDPRSPSFIPQSSDSPTSAELRSADIPEPRNSPSGPESSTIPSERTEFTSSPAVNPQRPPSLPESTNAAAKTDSYTARFNADANAAAKPMDPEIPYPTGTTASWTPHQSTPPEDPTISPAQQAYHGYGKFAPPPFDATASYNLNYQPSGMSYGYAYPYDPSFYPHSARSYVSASPVQSSYEGYTMANTPHIIHSRTDSLTHQHRPYRTAMMHNPPAYVPCQARYSYTHAMPQFGSHFPITPSATPSTSGSQKPGRSPISETEQPDQAIATESHGEDAITKEIRTEYKEWCDRALETLEEVTDSSLCLNALFNHVLDNFNNPTFADCELYISHTSHRFEPAVVSLHSLLIAQTPKLRDLVQNAEVREDGKKQVLLDVEDQYTNPTALKAALRVCYGEHPSSNIGYPRDLASESEISTVWMNNALALAAAGHLVGMPGVAHRGEQIASIVLSWDNVEFALSFAMDKDIERPWGSSSDSSGFPHNASELLLSCLYFVISNIPEDIRLDLMAQPLSSIDRLPSVPGVPSQSSRSRLSRIQFGDLPAETEALFSKHDTLASSILFSLPLEHVKFILDRIPLNLNHQITRPVIEEREHRRLRALNAQASPAEATGDEHLTLAERIANADNVEEGRLSVERV